MTTWFQKPTGWYGRPGVAHILRNREGDYWYSLCGRKVDWLMIGEKHWESDKQPYLACRLCAPPKKVRTAGSK